MRRPELPFGCARLGGFGALFLLALLAAAVGLAIFLAGKLGSGDDGGDAFDAKFAPDPDDPSPSWERLGGAGAGGMPSARPSTVPSWAWGDPPAASPGGSSAASPDSSVASLQISPTPIPLSQSANDYLSPSPVPSTTTAATTPLETKMTNRPTPKPTDRPTPKPTARPTRKPTGRPTPKPITPSPTESTPEPTPPSPYPLLGPYTERGMRLILYGTPYPLTRMGRTQWRMLTAAYVEQFFNVEGGGADAVQNVVFDVAAEVEIEGEEGLAAGGRRGGLLRKGGGGGLVVTFAATLRYRTFSAAIGAGTVAERPFYDDAARSDYVGFLIANNAVAHMGDIAGASRVFFGDDVPEEPATPATPGPTPGPQQQQAEDELVWQDLPELEDVWQDLPESEDVARATPNPSERPTGRPTKFPTGRPTDPPTKFPTGRPTGRPTKFPTQRPTDRPVASAPAVGAATPAPSDRLAPRTAPEPSGRPTPEPTPRPSRKPTDKPATARPSREPTPVPTTSKPSRRQTARPTAGDRETYHPTPAELLEETYYPTPASLLSTFPTFAPVPPEITTLSTAANVVVAEEAAATEASAANVIPAPNPTQPPRRRLTAPPAREPAADPPLASPTYGPTRGPATDPPSAGPTDEPTDGPTTDPPSAGPTDEPTGGPTTDPPSAGPTDEPTVAPTEHCELPVEHPVCPLLVERECCRPACAWDAVVGRCSPLHGDSGGTEWSGMVEFGQTHVVRAVGETRHAPRIVAQREVELLFTPGGGGRRRHDGRRLGPQAKAPDSVRPATTTRRIGSLGTAYLVRGDGRPVLDAGAQRLLDGSGAVFSLPNDVPDLDVLVDLGSVRLVAAVSVVLRGDATLGAVRLGLHYDDGRNQEEGDPFRVPDAGWTWRDAAATRPPAGDGDRRPGVEISIPVLEGRERAARYVLLRMEGMGSASRDRWGLGRIEITGSADGLPPSDHVPPRGDDNDGGFPRPATRAISPDSNDATATASPRSFDPSSSTRVRVAVYSRAGRLIGATVARDPSRQRGILERRLSPLQIEDYSDSIWSATLPFNWVEEGNVVWIGCVDDGGALLVHRLELTDLAQFSEHTITRTKLAVFGDKLQVARLDHATHPARRLVRDLYSVMPVAELRWVDTDLWHLPYVVVMGTDGPALVSSERERRDVTGNRGEEISWKVLKNFLTIRHSLAMTGSGLSSTDEDGANSPYASGTSVFMGWSLSKQKINDDGDDDDEWEWEDLGYWDTLAAAAWTGWCTMKAGDECSNYFVHEMGHAQTMQHFNAGTAADWGIADEYPLDGRHTPLHPWGYDEVSRRFRTWFDPFRGDGKLDPLNGAGEGPTPDQCFSQYTPYQAKRSQEWASRTPVLLSGSSSGVPADGAYRFDRATRGYAPLGDGASLADAVGGGAMPPDRVGIPVVTFVGTVGRDPGVCQTYPALRSRSGNTFELPDPFSGGLLSAFDGAAHFAEVRFHDGTTARALIAVEGDLDGRALRFFSFNVALERRPTAVALYRFTDDSYPRLTPGSGTELLHLRPTALPPGDPLVGLPPLSRVGRGWLGDSPDVVLDRFCATAEECDSDGTYGVEWRGDVGSDGVVYASSLAPEAQGLLGATVFKVPASREWDSAAEYTITILATRSFNGGLGSSPLLTTDPASDGEGSSDVDTTHGVRIVAPWEMNGSLPAGTYRSIPGAFKISAIAIGGDGDDDPLLDLDVSLLLATVTAPPTSAPTRKPSPGPTKSPIQVRYYIDWNLFTCVTDGESTEWAPAYPRKEDCCHSHMAYDFAMCMRSQ